MAAEQQVYYLDDVLPLFKMMKHLPAEQRQMEFTSNRLTAGSGLNIYSSTI